MMRKVVIMATLFALLMTMGLSQLVSASSVLYITITATGSEIDITCNRTGWTVGIVNASGNVTTGVARTWAQLESKGTEDVDVTIGGRSMKNAAGTVTWTLADDGAAGAATFGMYAGHAGKYWNVLIKNVGETLNKLVTNFSAGTQNFGLCFLAPTETLGNEVMEMVGADGNANDEPRGLVLTGSPS